MWPVLVAVVERKLFVFHGVALVVDGVVCVYEELTKVFVSSVGSRFSRNFPGTVSSAS